MTDVAPVSVVIPTIGRVPQLEQALASLAGCDPAPAEIVVITQSADAALDELAARFAAHHVRVVERLGRSIGQAINAGLNVAECDTVLVTNDDCTVAEDWIAVALREHAGRADVIVTGSVLPVGNPEQVPSLKEDAERRDYTGTLVCNAIYGANMVADRMALLDFGAFDERVRPSAEDNDLCYRWLAAGRTILYVPELRIWHHDWRTPAEMTDLYVRYGRGQGVFLAKHLRARDRRILPVLRESVRWPVLDIVRSVRQRRRPSGEAVGVLRGLPGGLLEGLRVFGRRP